MGMEGLRILWTRVPPTRSTPVSAPGTTTEWDTPAWAMCSILWLRYVRTPPLAVSE